MQQSFLKHKLLIWHTKVDFVQFWKIQCVSANRLTCLKLFFKKKLPSLDAVLRMVPVPSPTRMSTQPRTVGGGLWEVCGRGGSQTLISWRSLAKSQPTLALLVEPQRRPTPLVLTRSTFGSCSKGPLPPPPKHTYFCVRTTHAMLVGGLVTHCT